MRWRRLAQALRLTFLPVEVRTSRDFADAFSVLSRERVHALTATENPLNVEHRGLSRELRCQEPALSLREQHAKVVRPDPEQ